MKPFTLGLTAVLAVVIGWSINTEADTPATTTLVPLTVSYVTITDPPATTSSTISSTTTSSTTTSSTTTSSTTTTTTTTIPPLLPVDHVCYDWLPTLLEAGWPADSDILATALTIMWRESRCQPEADSGPDHGLFQINKFWSSQQSNPPNWLNAQGIASDHDALFDPLTNARAAWAIYNYSLTRNGDGFLPWTTYSGRP